MGHDRSTAEKTLHDQTNLLPRTQLLVVFSTLALTLLICFVDQNGISVALPTIAEDLNAQETISWAGTSSLIANTAFQMIYGRLTDIFGRKTVYICAICLVGIADLLCGLSQSPAMFYIFRAVAGIGGGGVTNIAMIIVSDVVSLEDRGKYQGFIGLSTGVGNVIGPFLAAVFISTSTWRAFFWLLCPLAVVCAAVTFLLLPSKPPQTKLREGAKNIDYWGVLAISVAVIFLLIPISGGGAYFPWRSPLVISMLAIGTLCLVIFVLVEWRVSRLPMMPLGIFRSHVVTTILLQSFLLGAVYQSYLYYLPMYFQNARQYSVLTSAAMSISLMVLQAAASVTSGMYISQYQRYGEVLWFGFGIWTVGSGLTCLFDRHTPKPAVVVVLGLVGVGVGCVFQPTLIALQALVPKGRRAVITSNRNFFRCAGGACGLAVSAAVLQGTLRAHLPLELSYVAQSSYAIQSVPEADLDVVLEAYMAASHAVFVLQVPLIGLCLLGCFLVRDRGLQHPEDEKVEQDIEAPADNVRGGVLESLPGNKEEKEGVADRAQHHNSV